MSTDELVELFHHRWAPPALALLAERGGARFVELSAGSASAANRSAGPSTR